jgi:hypothetical protein
MLAEIKRQRVVNYANYGEDVRRKDGSLVEFVTLLDPDSSDVYDLTLDAGLNGGRADLFAMVDLVLEGQPNQKVEHDTTGRARVGRAVPKFRVMAMKTVADVNGEPPKKAAPAASAAS